MSRIVIVGGGIIGSSTAYHLARAGAAADVIVVEPDPTYEFAATPRAVGGIRLQHALPENVEMSLYGDHVYSHFAEEITGGKVAFDPQFYRIGYLYQVNGAGNVAALEANAEMQRGFGVEVHLLDRDALRQRYPSFGFDGVDAAALSPDDGQIDPNAALMGVRRAAEGLGITYLKDRVVGLDVSGGLVTTARLESGGTLDVDTLVNAANCWSPGICEMVGMPVVKSGWVGHYDMNRLDGNMILDRFHKVPNFILAAGFSGHGLQHAPAVGRAIKEMILDGGFRSIDLTRFGYRRIEENNPLPDDGPKA
jgi:FAD-dependent oxidoreductase domain-containing protein 1